MPSRDATPPASQPKMNTQLEIKLSQRWDTKKRMKSAIYWNSLPPNILGTIFQVGLGPYIFSGPMGPAEREDYLSSICLVSKRWMEVAFQVPDLWSLITIDYRRLTSKERSLGSYWASVQRITRAKAAALDIILDLNIGHLPSQEDQWTFWLIWEMLTLRSPQWRSLKIGRVALRSDEELKRLIPQVLPNVTQVKMAITILASTPVLFAPRLEDFRCIHPNFAFPFVYGNGLRYLHLAGNIVPALSLLGQCHLLETLAISSLEIRDRPTIERTHLRSLRRFQLEGRIRDVDRFLPSISTPQLETIALMYATLPEEVDIPDRTTTLLPSLNTVEYHAPNTGGHLRPLHFLLTVVGDTERLTIRMPAGMVMVPSQDVHRVKEVVEELIWVEERVARMVITGRDGDRTVSFKDGASGRNNSMVSPLCHDSET